MRNKFDFSISEKGELLYDSGLGDIMKSDKDNLKIQMCINRIKSIVGDWYNTTIGANVEEFFGYSATNETCTSIINAITNSLIYDGYAIKEDIFIIPSIDNYNIDLTILIKSDYEFKALEIKMNLDLVGEVKVEYDTNS